MKKSNVFVFFVTIILFALVSYATGKIFFDGRNLNFREIPSSAIEVVIVGDNEYGSTLEASLRGKVSDEDDYTYQWWYLDYSKKDTKRKTIVGENKKKFVINSDMKDRTIGVSVYDKKKNEYTDITDVKNNISEKVRYKDIKIELSSKESFYTGDYIYANRAKVEQDLDVVYTYYTDSKCSKLTDKNVGSAVTGGVPIDVGNYFVQATLVNKVGVINPSSECVAHNIVPVKVNINWSNNKFVYNGNLQGSSAGEYEVVSGEVIKMTNDFASNVGEYKTIATCKNVIGGRSKCSNYSFDNTTNFFVIEKRDNNILFEESVNTYNGDVIYANEAVSSIDNEIKYTYYTDNKCSVKTDSDVGSGILGSAPVDAGDYYVQAELIGDSNNKGAISACVSHKILPKEVDLNWKNTELHYNGKFQGPTVSSTGMINSEVLVFERETFDDKGIYEVEAICKNVLSGRGKCSNYKLNNDKTIFTIHKKISTLELFNNSYIYDGEEKSISGKTNSDGNILYTYYKDAEFSVLTDANVGAKVLGGAPTDAGVYYVKGIVNETDDYLSVTKTIKLTISPKKVKFSWDNQNYDYNGSYVLPTFESISGINNEIINLVALNGATDVGEYETEVICSTVSNGRGVCSNYQLTNSNGKFKLNKVDPVINVSSYNKIYNTKFDSVEPNYTFTGGIANVDGEVKYYLDNKCEKIARDNPVDAGEYYFKVIVKGNNNFNSIKSECIPYNIKRKDITVSWSGEKYVYNGNEQGPVAVVDSGLGENIVLDTDKEVNAGTYISTATCKRINDGRNNCNNYSLLNDQFSYTIEKNNAVITVDKSFNMRYPNDEKYILNFDISNYEDNDIFVSTDGTFEYKYLEKGKLELIPQQIGISNLKLCTVENNNYNSVCKNVIINVSGYDYIKEEFNRKKSTLEIIDKNDNAKINDGLLESGRGNDVKSLFGVVIETKTWSTLRFNYGLYNKSGDANMTINLVDNHGNSKKILTTNNNVNADYSLTLEPNTTYNLEIDYFGGTREDYAYLDNIIVTSKKFEGEIKDELVLVNSTTSVKAWFKKTINSICDFFYDLIF